MTYIYDHAFANCPELTDVHCYAEKAPQTESDAFDGSYIEYATLHVPDASAYRTVSPWSNFGTIVSVSMSVDDALVEQYNKLLADAIAALAEAKGTPTELINSVSQLSSPYTEQSEGSLANLLDGNISTFWHSTWRGGNVAGGLHYLQVELVNPDEAMLVYANFTRRPTSMDHVTNMSVLGTNNPNAEKSACEELLTYDCPYSNNTETIKSPTFSTKGYRYLRFYANTTTSNRGYWHISEFQLYGFVSSDGSIDLSLMEEDDILQAVINAQAGLSNYQITEEVYNELKEAYDAFMATGIISPTDDDENSVQLTSFPALGRSDLLFYDYDGDGVMEMLGHYMKKTGYNQKESGYAIMDDDEKLMSFMGFRQEDDLKIANGNGDICIGNRIWTGNSGFDATRNYQSSPYIYYTNTDLDNDGNIDMVSVNNGLTMLKSHPGDDMYEKNAVRIVQDSTYLAYLKSQEKSYNPLGSGMSVVSGYTGPTSVTSGVSRTIDLNGDGWLDILSSDSKSAYMSLAGNGYYEMMFTGAIYPYDLDGDGMLDYLLYDGNSVYTVITDATGQSTQKRIFDNNNVKEYICRDFDHDGDVDVLVYVTDNTYTYFIFMRNDGNGTFKKKEEYLEGIYTFRDCRDYDADGLYEILLWNYNENAYYYDLRWQTPINKIVKVNPNFTLTDASEDFAENPTANSLKMFMGDYDNDGYTDMKLTSPKEAYDENDYMNSMEPYCIDAFMSGRYSMQTKQNTAPQKMMPPTVAMDEGTGYLRIVWERGEDAETSACDLTYEVRIGTAPGKGDVLCPLSLPDGRRRVVADGSMGTQLQTLFNIGAHPAGTYYVSVQAIDAGGLGGAWSDEAVYEHDYTAPNIMANVLSTSTADTITVMANKYDTNAIYRWAVTNGEVISQNLNLAQVRFNAAGSQQVMLTSLYDGVEYHSEPLDIDVNAFKNQRDSNGELVERNLPSVFFDINQDGYPDGIIYGYFVINDGKGNFSKYPKSFNSDLYIYGSSVLDLNLDGFPDVLSDEGGYINDEEGEFELNPGLTTKGNGDWIDFTNTGYYCTIPTYDGKLWTTDNYIEYTTTLSFGEIPSVCDLNRDGYMDIVVEEYWSSDHRNIVAYINNGNGTFQQMNLMNLLATDVLDVFSYKIADINNDGYMDIITGGKISKGGFYSGISYYYRPLRIFLGKSDFTYTFAHEIKCDNCNIESVKDFNNDGYLDVCVRTRTNGEYSYSYIYFDQNMQYEIVAAEDGAYYDPFVVIESNGYPQGGTYNTYHKMSTIKNESPQAPALVTAKQTAD